MSALYKKPSSAETIWSAAALATVLLMAALTPIGYAQDRPQGVLFSQPGDSPPRTEPIPVTKPSPPVSEKPGVAFSSPKGNERSGNAVFSAPGQASKQGNAAVGPRFSEPSRRLPPTLRALKGGSHPLFSVAQDTPETLPSPSDTQPLQLLEQGEEGSDQTLGEEPEETNYNVQFLRDDTILLEPGQYQWDITFQYLMTESDTTIVQNNGGLLTIAEGITRQRVLSMPIELRLGLTPVTQVFVNVPFGWSNTETVFLATDEFANAGGIGDISAGFTHQLIDGDECFPDVLGFVSFSAPTGNSSFATSISTPGTALGEGFWTISSGLTFIQTYDPVVIFAGFGYRHRFRSTFDTALGTLTVDPGKQAFYRFGAGFAVNPRVTFSASFIGSYIGDDTVDGVRLGGSRREPMSIRLATTIVRDPKCNPCYCKPEDPNYKERVRTVEPFVTFGITDAAVDTLFGISFTR